MLKKTRGSFPHMLFIITVTAYYVFRLIEFALSLPKLIEMYRFYTYLLGIPDVSTLSDQTLIPRPTSKPYLGRRLFALLGTSGSTTP